VVSTDYKRLFLQGLKWDAEDAGITLAEALKVAARAKLTSVDGGLVLIGVAGNGMSQTFTLPANGANLNPVSAAELCAEMLRRYDEAVADLAGQTPAVESPTDAQIFATMKTLLKAVRSYRSDFSQLRTGEVVA
jgi:hypothetical protein